MIFLFYFWSPELNMKKQWTGVSEGWFPTTSSLLLKADTVTMGRKSKGWWEFSRHAVGSSFFSFVVSPLCSYIGASVWNTNNRSCSAGTCETLVGGTGVTLNPLWVLGLLVRELPGSGPQAKPRSLAEVSPLKQQFVHIFLLLLEQ